MKHNDEGINTRLGQAITNLQHGRLTEAEAVFQKILKLNPTHADAKHLLGVIAIQRGQHDLAIRLIAQAIQHNPNAAMYHNNYCYALHTEGRLDEALCACERAIQLTPNFPEAHFNCGNVLRDSGRLEAALAAYDKALQLRPQYIDALWAKGASLLAAGRGIEAEDSFRRVIALDPSHARAYNNLAVVLVNTGRPEEAMVACDRAIQLVPDYAHAHNCRGDALKKLRRLDEALEACEKAISLMPKHADAHYNRGNILLETGCVEEAEASYSRALELKPNDKHLHSNILFTLAARAKLPFDKMLEALRQWDNMHGQEGRLHPLPKRLTSDKSGHRLRIGYVSPHLRTHVVSFFFEPLLSAHDRTHFEIFCYASFLEAQSDATTQRMRETAEHWRFVGDKNDAELAKLIHEDGIDILVDLTGHTAGNRLKAFTYKPAPVQVTYLGFFAPTGLATMDYWITDEVLHPLNTLEQSTEIIYRLPRCWVCYQPPELAPDVSPRNTSDKPIVFGSFSNLSKLTTEVIKTWSQILHKLPESFLLVMARPLGETKIQSLLAEKFASHGITQNRLILRKGVPYKEYYATYAEVDIVLDTFPRTGGTTTAQALWMGVPVITLAGKRYVERISASKLAAIGLEDLITYSQEEYIEKALSLAHDSSRRADLRENLRRRMAQSPLCNGEDLARTMETAYLSMWERFVSKPS